MKILPTFFVPLCKRVCVLWKRLYLYPAPEPLPRTRLFWLAFGLVTLAFLLFSSYFICYVTHLQAAYATNAEDLGIMDQAIWSTVHGQILHQTICNTISETNCAGSEGITRLAIHVEPILFPISLLYLFWPDPRTLLVLQTIVVAAGAYPAFWFARLRLRNELAAVVIALLYLLYPVQQQATTDDFHAVTFTASLLLFTFYFLYTRRIGWLFAFAFLSMACKEEIPLVITMFGLWSLLFQRYRYIGLTLMLIGLLWFCLAFYVVMPHFSPTGQPLLISRYTDLGQGPVQAIISIFRNPKAFLKQYILDKDHLVYLHILFSPAIYLPLLAPWALIITVPSLLINMTSSSKDMYSGLYQYNAEIVPILIIATVEALVLLLWLTRLVRTNWKLVQKQTQQTLRNAYSSFPIWQRTDFMQGCVLAMLLGLVLLRSIRFDVIYHGRLPFSHGFSWPAPSAHTALAEQFIDKIPPDISVSAQSELVPHLSHRSAIYLFPYKADQAKYVFLDVTSDVYPYYSFHDYLQAVKNTLSSGQYSIIAAQDGYLLLRRGLPLSDTVPCPAKEQGQSESPGPVLSNLLGNVCSPPSATGLS
jgi:uncharacterized membrane protein